jgi:enoyl-[acyl-carrier-protein] reductase (NADH)
MPNIFPKDIAETVYFLASGLQAEATGSTIYVHAGD